MILKFLSVKFIWLNFFAVFLVIHPIESFSWQFHLLRAWPLAPIAELFSITVYSQSVSIFSCRIENLEIYLVLLPLVIDHYIFYSWSFLDFILEWFVIHFIFLSHIIFPCVILTDVLDFIFIFLGAVATFSLLFFQKFHIGYPVEPTLVFLEMTLVKKDVFVHKVAFVAIGFRDHNIVSNPNMSFRPSHFKSILDVPWPELRDISDDCKLLTIISIKLYFECQFITLISFGLRNEAVVRWIVRRYKGPCLNQFFVFCCGVETVYAAHNTLTVVYVSNDSTLVLDQDLLFVNVFISSRWHSRLYFWWWYILLMIPFLLCRAFYGRLAPFPTSTFRRLMSVPPFLEVMVNTFGDLVCIYKRVVLTKAHMICTLIFFKAILFHQAQFANI